MLTPSAILESPLGYLKTSSQGIFKDRLRNCCRFREPHGSIKIRTSSSSLSIFRVLTIFGCDSFSPLVSKICSLAAFLIIFTATWASDKNYSSSLFRHCLQPYRLYFIKFEYTFVFCQHYLTKPSPS